MSSKTKILSTMKFILTHIILPLGFIGLFLQIVTALVPGIQEFVHQYPGEVLIFIVGVFIWFGLDDEQKKKIKDFLKED